MQRWKTMRLTHEFSIRADVELPTWAGWLPLAFLLGGSSLTRVALTSWLFMWVMATALWAECKWLVLWQEIRFGGLPEFKRTIAFLFLWPGMDAHRFLSSNPPPSNNTVIAPHRFCLPSRGLHLGGMERRPGVRFWNKWIDTFGHRISRVAYRRHVVFFQMP
jgi:hypothetical protein